MKVMTGGTVAAFRTHDEGSVRPVTAPAAAAPVERAAGVLRALANPSRLSLLVALSGGERTVGSLCDDLGFTQAYASQQLARLRSDDLLSSRREGRRIFYRISDPRILKILEALQATYGLGP